MDSSAAQIRRAVAYYGHTEARFLHTSAAHHLHHAAEALDAIVSVFGAIGTTEPSQLLTACSRRLAHQGILAFCVPHPQRTGTIPHHPYTCIPVALPDGASHTVERWDMEPTAWVLALNRAGLTVTSVHHLHASADTRLPTTLLITARKP
ncbi:SAM-dependent methyltransferase [Actinoplanes campanulatus]|uniref:SAM-dependent methyltransferase n=1 Tax=Actinoplanes campanulatus TaxID=113559 RepID=A0A7W5ALC5_9ACTN|nr:hypothetical protein [Actinoplanes campanulatus]MBB3098182.1 SAM-dependent methyltransferase [Actinoplanes campanulatus]GGN35061.1 hypothetical protein GCM10010109_58730 [Actinoplanes campanulatus]GID38858.1 hypothetical protein Aca09nite_53640 [Actinoplanes campanulatus]